MRRELLLDFEDIRNEIPFTPDVAIFGLSWLEKHKYYGVIKNLDCPKVCFIFKPQNDLIKKVEFCKRNKIDLILSSNKDYNFYGKDIGTNAELFPYGFDPEIFKPRKEIPKRFDLGFSGALHDQKHYPSGSFQKSNLRRMIHAKISKKSHIKLFWKSSDVFETARIHDNVEYAKTINSSIAWLATMAANDDITPRYYEVMGSGTLLLCEMVPDVYKKIFINGKNCISFKNSLEDFDEQLNSVLMSEVLIHKTTLNAVSYAHKYHTWHARALQLIKLLRKILR